MTNLICNSGIQLNNLDDAHKIMEAALEQEAELKKFVSNPIKQKRLIDHPNFK